MKRDYRNPEATSNYRKWLQAPKDIPFSFVYGSKEYRGFSADVLSLKEKVTETKNGK